jgi:hypothetical protein
MRLLQEGATMRQRSLSHATGEDDVSFALHIYFYVLAQLSHTFPSTFLVILLRLLHQCPVKPALLRPGPS